MRLFPFNYAGVAAPLRSTVRVIRGPQNTYPRKNAPILADPLGSSAGRYSCLDGPLGIGSSEMIPAPGCSFLSGSYALHGLLLVPLSSGVVLFLNVPARGLGRSRAAAPLFDLAIPFIIGVAWAGFPGVRPFGSLLDTYKDKSHK